MIEKKVVLILNLFLIDVVNFDLKNDYFILHDIFFARDFHEVFVEPATVSNVLSTATWLQGLQQNKADVRIMNFAANPPQ